MTFGWNLLWFIIGVSLLVTVHEFGHFWVARKLGFKVLRFSIGFGKPLYTRVGRAPDYTEYVLAALPLGGYVKMLDERDGQVSAADAPRAFGAKPPWKRILVMLAGPAANIVFAIVVLWAVFWTTESVNLKPVVGEVIVGKPAAVAGLRTGDEIVSINDKPAKAQGDAALMLLDGISDDGDVTLQVRGRDGLRRDLTLAVSDGDARRKLTEPNRLFSGLGFGFWEPERPAVIAQVKPEGPAAKAGLRAGDLIISIDGKPIANSLEFREYIQARPATLVQVKWRRGGAELSNQALTTSEVDEDGKRVGRMSVVVGAEPTSPQEFEKLIPESMKIRTSYGPVAAFSASVNQAWDLTAMQAKFFARMLTGKISMKNLSSPIGIAGYAGDSARAGPDHFVMFLVLISLSLGFLNLLPIPILDGGQIVFVVAEWLKGSPLSERAQMVGWNAGLVMLALLMGVAVFNDLSSRFGSF